MQMPAGLYRNTANEKGLYNYIAIKLKENPGQRTNINVQIELTTGDETQAYEYSPYRGYMSTSEKIAHFGLGTNQKIDDLKIIWPDDKMIHLKNVEVNQRLTLEYENATSTYNRPGLQNNKLFKPQKAMAIVHEENEYNDFIREILLPYKTSTLGPIICKGDVNGDGLTDIYMGSSFGKISKLLINQGSGNFIESIGLPQERIYEDGGAAFLDVDNDRDLDLFVSSGGNEFAPGHKYYQDRLYINDGQGKFLKATGMPQLTTSNSTVIPLDFDKDGDMDIFVGGRQVPGKYGKPTSSHILQNNGNNFSLVTNNVAPMFENIGMVTDAKLEDLNGDGKEELIVVGEWMPVSIYQIGTQFVDLTNQYGLSETSGWWNTVEIADVNNDGTKDIIGGNLGHNIKYKASPSEPFKVYTDDFDKNGTHDVYLGYYQSGKCYPVRGRECSSQQMPFVKEKFGSYKDFGLATIDQVLEGKVSESTSVNQAHTFSSTVFLNKNGEFKSVILPNEAQIAPVNGIVVDDFDKDGKQDIFLAGNMYQREVETTRSDAGKGCLLTFEEDGSIRTRRTPETGISADKDVRSVSKISNGDHNLLVIANNNAPVQFYSY